MRQGSIDDTKFWNMLDHWWKYMVGLKQISSTASRNLLKNSLDTVPKQDDGGSYDVHRFIF